MATFANHSSSPFDTPGTSRPAHDMADGVSAPGLAPGSAAPRSNAAAPHIDDQGPGTRQGPGSDGDDLLGRVVQGAHATIDRLAETAAPHVHRLQDGVATASETLQSRADQARATGDEWAESLRCTVRDNPLAAVATAVAVGMLIARLTR